MIDKIEGWVPQTKKWKWDKAIYKVSTNHASTLLSEILIVYVSLEWERDVGQIGVTSRYVWLCFENIYIYIYFVMIENCFYFSEFT